MSSVRPSLKSETPKAVTAWDLRTGRVVYRAADGAWSPDVADAAPLTGDDAEAALAAAKAQADIVTDPYFMEVGPAGGIAGRETVRESIRAAGPTTRRDLGRQARNP